MLTNRPEDLREMGLKTDTDSGTVENIMLGDLTRRADLHNAFMQINRSQAKPINWAKEKSENQDGLRCNFPVILCEFEATIPGATSGATAKTVPKKLYTDL